MKRAILEDRTPNLFVLEYDLSRWAVRTVLLVPHFAFTLSTLEKRPPLAPTARRAGWIGCNILLDRIPPYARIRVIDDGKAQSATKVRSAYRRLCPLEALHVEKRGWTLDVLQVVQSLGKTEFTLADVYRHAAALARLHPKNLHVRDKTRQQLQLLRDLRLLDFLAPGRYRLR
jgi:type II restriction enzyme